MAAYPILGINLQERIPGSRYFAWCEALWLPTMQSYAAPTMAQMEAIKRQAAALDNVRDFFGRPINVHVWLRPPTYNALVKGAPQSAHLFGLATDFDIIGLDCEEVKTTLQQKGASLYPGRGEINSKGWVHLDLMGSKWFNA